MTATKRTATPQPSPDADPRLAVVLDVLDDVLEVRTPEPAMRAILGAIDWNEIAPKHLAAIVAILMADSEEADGGDARRDAIVSACVRIPGLAAIRLEAREQREVSHLPRGQNCSPALVAEVLR